MVEDLTPDELVIALRAIADRIEAMPRCTLKLDVKVHIHNVDRIEQLRWAKNLSTSPISSAHSSDGTHWIEGSVHGCDITAFYTPGLLSKSKKTVVVEVESGTDLSLLNE